MRLIASGASPLSARASASAIAWRVISSAALAVNAWLSASVTAGSSAMRRSPRTRSTIF